MPHIRLLAGASTDTLALGEQLLLWSLRSWHEAVRSGRCPLCAIVEPFGLIKAEAVAEALHRSLLLLLGPGNRTLVLNAPRCGQVGEEESTFLLAAGAAFHQSEAMASRMLGELLQRQTAADLASALRPLAELLGRHGLGLPERLPAVTRLATPIYDERAATGLSRLH